MPENNDLPAQDGIRSGAAMRLFAELYQARIESLVMDTTWWQSGSWYIKPKERLECEAVETDLP
jgi:hypothetical protein